MNWLSLSLWALWSQMLWSQASQPPLSCMAVLGGPGPAHPWCDHCLPKGLVYTTDRKRNFLHFRHKVTCPENKSLTCTLNFSFYETCDTRTLVLVWVTIPKSQSSEQYHSVPSGFCPDRGRYDFQTLPQIIRLVWWIRRGLKLNILGVNHLLWVRNKSICSVTGTDTRPSPRWPWIMERSPDSIFSTMFKTAGFVAPPVLRVPSISERRNVIFKRAATIKQENYMSRSSWWIWYSAWGQDPY